MSTSLKNTLVLANETGAEVFLLAEVEMELEAHWLRDYAKTNREVQLKMESLNRLVRDISDIKNHFLVAPENSDIKKSYKKAVDAIVKKKRIRRVHFCKTCAQ